MNPFFPHLRLAAATIVLFALVQCPIAEAQATPVLPSEQTSTASASEEKATQVLVDSADSEQVRRDFNQLLHRLPPEVGKILKLDPTLFTNPSYLGSYPELGAFVAKHPEVAHSPRYYLERVYVGDAPPEPASIRMWRDMVEGISIFAVFSMIAFAITWLIRTLIEHRRWSRLSRVQAEVHNKLLDRFTSNEDLLTYIQTPSGKRFLESAPIPLQEGPRAVSVPASRILWSMQIGVVLAAAGLGLSFISGNVDKEVSQPVSAMGVLALSVGIGFVISAVISYLISRRLGLWGSAEPAAE